MSRNNAAKEQHSIIGVTDEHQKEFEYNPHPDARWFQDGGNLGMFIHYGISVVNGCVELSWGMMANKSWESEIGCQYQLSPENYFCLEKDFCPEKFEASMDRLMGELKKSGFTYAVLTTKHHDGFSLWPSKYGDFHIGIRHKNMDLVKIFADACDRHGLKKGFYYSPPDWHYMRDHMSFYNGKGTLYDKNHRTVAHIEEPDEELKAAYRSYLKGQLTELLTGYGKVDILWFDGTCEKKYEVITPQEIRELQPGIVFNNRHFGYGDFVTPEVEFPETKPEQCWEYCGIWTDGPWWAFMYQCKDFKSAKWLYGIYQKCREWKGNCLINVGPMPDGSMPEMTYTRLKELRMLMELS